jgi:recombinational DNA repair ATPase RecF
MDDALLDVVLGRIDDDTTLSEGATELLLAACQSDHALAQAVGGEPPPRPEPRTAEQAAAEPVGAFLASITAEGFRGVGPAQTLRLHPGRGLTVVVGRNGSGKSSFAEALEVLLTGSIARLDGQSSVFREGWRNLHHPHPARVAAELHVEGAPGTTRVERTWADAADLASGTATAQVTGEKATGLDRLGWTDQLTTYRPFLAHTELEAMLDSPSGLYDRLASVLGLDDLTGAANRLRDHRLALEKQARSAEAERNDLAGALADVDDERAAQAHAVLTARVPDLAELARIVTGTGSPQAGGALDVLRRLVALVPPDLAAVDRATGFLRDAANGLDAVAGSEAARAKALADLLGQAVRFHDRHPADTDCPVCGRSDALDKAWHDHATAEIDRLRTEADTAERAHTAARAAVQAATTLIRPLPDAVAQGEAAGIDTSALAEAWAAWADDPPPARPEAPDDLRRLADHLATATALVDAAGAVARAATAELAAREDRWSPVAKDVAAWIDQGRAAAHTKPAIAELKKAEAWLKTAHDDIRNERLRPIATRAQETWRALRHESNVDLGAIRLSGDRTRRRVDLDATVDGTNGNALGVMSQGEVNALALSVFLPRATLTESPFRFVVIDDPVQAMDPAKVDGLAHVLHDTAHTHQVVVFTHDDRLPSAIRRLGLDARIVQVQRRPGSVVEIASVDDPVDQALRDARAVAATTSAPDAVRSRVVPGLCRLALETALTEITQRRQLQAGRPHHEVDAALDGAHRLTEKAALALFGDSSAGGDVLRRLNQIHRRHGDTFQALKAGAHGEPVGSAHRTVDATRDLVEALRTALR